MSDPLRVGVNLCWLVPGVVGGSEDLLLGWLGALAAHSETDEQARPIELTLFGRQELVEAHPWLGDAFPFVGAVLAGRARARRVLVETGWLVSQQRGHHIEVMHHAGGVVPLRHRSASVLTVHDIQPLDQPETFSALKRRYLGFMLPRSVRTAQVMAVTSDFVVDRLVDRLGAERRRCHVVRPVLRPRPHLVIPAQDQAVRRRYQIGAHFVLYPAVPYPFKNHRVLYEAMRRLPAEHEAQLVLTGGVGPEDQGLAAFVATHALQGRILRVGRIPAADYETLLAAADAVVFPSRYEGFGLGALDGLAVGAPLLVSDIAPLAEVVGPEGVRIGIHDAATWSAEIDLVTSSPQRRAELAAASLARAGCFDARRSAAGLRAAYRAAAAGLASARAGACGPVPR